MAMTDPAGTAASLIPGGGPSATPISVLHVGADGGETDRLGPRLERDDGISVETVATTGAAASRLGATDCVVAESDGADDALVELLATVRARDPDIPFVLLASDPPTAVVEALDEASWTDCVRAPADDVQPDVLAQRIHRIVRYRRVTALARRALAAVEQGTDAVAIVAPDGTVEFANPLFARRLGSTVERLVGRQWRDLYPDAEVARLESDAFPSLADGWRWIGDCELSHDDGGSFVAQLRIDALDDGSMVFTLSDNG